MAAESSKAPISVYLLADHLDGILAAGEDLVARGHDWRVAAERNGSDSDFPSIQRVIAEDVRGFELMLIARVLKARDHANVLSTIDKRFAPLSKIFVSGTSQLLDCVEECGDSRQDDFETGDGLVSYVRGRGLIAADASHIARPELLTIDDSFQVAKRIPLGQLLDMAAAFLDALDAQYDLYVEDEESDAQSMPTTRKENARRERIPIN